MFKVVAKLNNLDHSIRLIETKDVPLIAGVVASAEGYELTECLSISLKGARETVDRYVDHPMRFGLVAVSDTDADIAGYLLAEVRNRLTDTFEDHSIINELDVDLFPASGKFCEIFDLWVTGSRRQKGIATQLKIALEGYLRAQDCWSIYTHTEARNKHVLHLNHKLDYRQVRTGPIWDDVPRVSLMKNLRN